MAKVTFPLKSEVDIKNLIDVVRKQLKLKINNNEINLDKLFYEVIVPVLYYLVQKLKK